LGKILWTDESTFCNNKMYNRRHIHYWCKENPHIVYARDNQRRFSVKVWCGVVGGHVLGPIFYEGNLTGNQYLQMLQNEIADLMDDLPLDIRINLFFQQDGAPPHNKNVVRNFLNNLYGDRWMGTNGPVRWPARSPDLTPLDFFIWGHVKNLVYNPSPPDTVEDLRNRILNSFLSIKRQSLVKATNSLKKRAKLCIRKGGHQFEQFL
jgi:hypothetical protein